MKIRAIGFFFQAEDGIRYLYVTGVQTCALPIFGGAIATGTLMAVFLANSGGAWDNAKKMVEDGRFGGKGSAAHEATIIGDTVGDPFKDTAGPAINPLIKVMNLVSLLIAPAVVLWSTGADKNTPLRVVVALAAALVVVVAVTISKRRPTAVAAEEDIEAASEPAKKAADGTPNREDQTEKIKV